MAVVDGWASVSSLKQATVPSRWETTLFGRVSRWLDVGVGVGDWRVSWRSFVIEEIKGGGERNRDGEQRKQSSSLFPQGRRIKTKKEDEGKRKKKEKTHSSIVRAVVLYLLSPSV
jgi:hypothetical protein